jgi:endonuclease III
VILGVAHVLAALTGITEWVAWLILTAVLGFSVVMAVMVPEIRRLRRETAARRNANEAAGLREQLAHVTRSAHRLVERGGAQLRDARPQLVQLPGSGHQQHEDEAGHAVDSWLSAGPQGATAHGYGVATVWQRD